MGKYKLDLDDGRKKIIEAKSPMMAKSKYYSTDDHFRTESSVESVQKINNHNRIKQARQPKRRNLLDLSF